MTRAERAIERLITTANVLKDRMATLPPGGLHMMEEELCRDIATSQEMVFHWTRGLNDSMDMTMYAIKARAASLKAAAERISAECDMLEGRSDLDEHELGSVLVELKKINAAADDLCLSMENIS